MLCKIVVPNDYQMEMAAELFCEVWKEPPWNEDFWVEENVIQDLKNIVDRGGKVLVAVAEGSVVGLAGGYPMGMAELYEKSESWFEEYFDRSDTVLYVAELATGLRHRRRGVGKMLLSGLIEWARIEKGISKSALRTDVGAVAARALYGSVGYVDTGVSSTEFPDRSYWLLVDE